MKNRKIVVVNQATNYLTVGICNAFHKRVSKVSLITGNVHEQGEKLNPEIAVDYINKYVERPQRAKMWSYIKACFRIYWLLLFRYRHHEVFFLSVPPMAYLLNIILPNRFSILIWDVYPDAFKITGMSTNHPVYKIWSALNKISFRKAHAVFSIGTKLMELISQYVDKKKIHFHPIWSVFQENEKTSKDENPFILNHRLQNKWIVQYSGNIGLTHNVEVIVNLAERMQAYEDVLFQIIGRGAREEHLKSLVRNKNLQNCVFLPFQSDEDFPYSLSAADIGVVVLNEASSKGSVPSKSYNLMSLGIPSLYIASEDSELQVYAQKYGNALCVSKKDLDKAIDFILLLKNDTKIYEKYSANAVSASENFKRENADKLVNAYLNISSNQS